MLVRLVRFVQVAHLARFVQAVSVGFLSRVEHFFVSGADPQVNADGANLGSPVTAVTFGKFCCKKELAIPGNKPKLTISPRPGSGSSGRPASGSPSTPGAGSPLLTFSGHFFHPAAPHSGPDMG